MKRRFIQILIIVIFIIGSLVSNAFIDANLSEPSDNVNIELNPQNFMDSDADEDASTSFRVLDFSFVAAILDKVTEVVDIL